MGGEWRHRGEARDHRILREAALREVEWGVTPCCRCQHPLEWGDVVNLDHNDDGSGYKGLSHAAPGKCRVCDRACNQAAGGEVAALRAGKRLRRRSCAVCGLPFQASRGSDGAKAQTCGSTACVTALKRLRKEGRSDPEPPPQSGRAW